MNKAGPVLVYSKYDWDLKRFDRILGEALPGVTVNYAGSPEQAQPYLADAQILYGWGFSSALLRAMPKLRWVQKMGAGVDDVVGDWPFGGDVILTRTDGRLIAARMVEYVVGAILDKTLRMDHARGLKAKRCWTYYEVGSIRQLTIGVAGLGEIGGEIARTLRSLGATVVGWRRSAVESDAVAELFVGDAALGDFAARCNVLVLVLPLTDKTKGIVGIDILQRLRPGAHVINVGRGGVLNEQALLDAIAAKRVDHATLDVFAVEPLPDAHPFWRNEQVTVTPHICGPLVPEDVAQHFIANFTAFSSGQPLRNVIDLRRQY
jgi:glyoxylate/hydroxypyruvate reductase A